MKKGFTVIELLAVIIILAIVALVATPIVLNVIDTAEKSAAESEINMIVNGVEQRSATITSEEYNTATGKFSATIESNGYTATVTNSVVGTLTKK